MFALTSLTTPLACVLLVELFSINVKPWNCTKLGLLAALAYPAYGHSTGAFHLARATPGNGSLILMCPLLLFLASVVHIACSSQPPLLPLCIGFLLGSSILAEILRQLAKSAGHSGPAQILVAHHLISLMVVTNFFLEQTTRNLTTWWLFTVLSYLFFWHETSSSSQPPKAR